MKAPLRFVIRLGAALAALVAASSTAATAEVPAASGTPFLKSELIFPLEHWHNHGSCLVEAPNGDLIACWFHGSGERTADDVKIEGARLHRGGSAWSERFTMADTPAYPDTNCCMFIDPTGRLWLLWPTILAHTWESALMKYLIASHYSADGPPVWETSEVMHVTPGAEFVAAVNRFADDTTAQLAAGAPGVERGQKATAWLAGLRRQAGDELTRRLGWFTRAHPFVLEGRRLIVPLYSDGFSFSLMNISDDWGRTWHVSAPLIGAGNIQPSLVQRKDGSLYALMRDNGPPPQRLMQSESRDRGETWSAVTDTEIPNPGSGAEIIALRDGRWLFVGNDLEKGRHRLTVQMSDDEGRTWKWRRALEEAPEGSGRFHYPSIIEARDGTLHVTYGYHLEKDTERDAEGKPRAKSIKHAQFNTAWIAAGAR